MRNKYPTIVCWRITSKCNRHCPFCFRPDRKELNTKEIYRIIDNLTEAGLKGMRITGGEPLSRKDMPKILKYIWGKGIKICLATNLDFYSKCEKHVNKYVSTIGIPLEGATSKVHDSLRGKGSFDRITNAMDRIYKKSRLKMYISTVLTKENIDDLSNIEELLSQYKERIVYWKIYNMINYSDRSFQSMKSNNISAARIKRIISSLGDRIGKDKVFYLSPKDRSEASFIINSDGEAVVPIQRQMISFWAIF